METSILKKDNLELELNIKILPDDFKPPYQKSFRDYCHKASFKGFRPGKVPPPLIEKMYGETIAFEVLNKLISQEINKVITDKQYNYIGSPILKNQPKNKFDVKSDEPYEMLFKIGYYDDFELNIDKSIEVTKYNIEMNDNDLETAINSFRESRSRYENADSIKENTCFYIEIVDTSNNLQEKEKIKVLFFKDFKDEHNKIILDKKVDDIITLNPSDHLSTNTFPESEIKSFDVKIKQIYAINKPNLDKEFFDSVFGENIVKTEEEFKEKIKSFLVEDNLKNSEKIFKNQAIEKILEKHKVRLPENFLREYWSQEYPDYVKDEQTYQNTLKSLQWSLLFNKIEKENETLKVENDEVKDYVKKHFGKDFAVNFKENEIDKEIDSYLNSDKEKFQQFKTSILENKLFDFISEKVNLKTKTVSLNEFNEINK